MDLSPFYQYLALGAALLCLMAAALFFISHIFNGDLR